jgi:hypothetical protein
MVLLKHVNEVYAGPPFVTTCKPTTIIPMLIASLNNLMFNADKQPDVFLDLDCCYVSFAFPILDD